MLSIKGRLLAAGLAMAGILRAEDEPERALPLFDAYLAQAAPSTIAYRTDVRLGTGLKGADAGRLAGESSYLGSFTYRPKTYAELSPSDRALLLRDPQFRAFLIRRCGQTGRAAGSQGNALSKGAQPKVLRFAIGPEEMLQDRPIVFTLPLP